MWFTELLGNNIGAIDPNTGAISEYPVTTKGAWPWDITSGPDGNLWFTEFYGNRIGRIRPTTGEVAEYALPIANSEPRGIAVGSDKNIWFVEQGADRIGMLDWKSGTIVESKLDPLPITPAGIRNLPIDITLGYDGNLWFTKTLNANGTFTDFVGNQSPTTGALSEYTVPPFMGQYPDIFEITAAPFGRDESLWFTERGPNSIGRIFGPSGAISSFAIPAVGTAPAYPYDITAGPDGNLWFTEVTHSGGYIGVMGRTGEVQAWFPLPTPKVSALGITAGPDCSIWFTEQNSISGDRIGYIK